MSIPWGLAPSENVIQSIFPVWRRSFVRKYGYMLCLLMKGATRVYFSCNKAATFISDMWYFIFAHSNYKGTINQ